MHNNIMAAGSRDPPPMLAMGRYPQWRSRFLRYIDTRPNGDALRKCILKGPYTPSTVIIPAVPAKDNSLAVPERTTVETILNMSPENKSHFESEKEAIHLILTGIGDEIYLTVDACKTAHEMWEAIERLQKGESLNIQDVKTNLFWEFGKFTSDDGETMESYYSQFYKLMNEIIRNNLTVITMQTSQESNLLALVATAQLHQDIHKGKEIIKPIIPPSESASEEDSDPEPAQKDKEMQKNLALIAKNQRTMTVAGTRETVGDQVQYDAVYNVFANEIQHSEQPESISNTCVVETGDSNVIPDSLDMCDNDIQNDQNVVEWESNSIRDSYLVALQNKQSEFERYKNLNDRTVDSEKLEHKLNETLGLLAQKDIDIKEGLKLKAYEILVVKEKHDELVKQSLLTKSHYEGIVKETTKVITNLKIKEEKDIDKMISMEQHLKFLNEIVYKRNQSIQTIHMLAPKCPTFNERPAFADPMYLKKAQYEKPCLYEIPHDQSDPANRLVPDREETLTLEIESRSKLNKDLVKPYDYTKLNSIYEIFKPLTQEYLVQLAHANEVRKKMWRKSFMKTKPNIFKNIDFLPVSKSISKSRQAYNVMTNNINHLRELVDQAWLKHSKDHFRAPTAHDMEILIKTCLTPLALKTQNDSFAFVHELKQEMHADLKYVESLEKEKLIGT
ncbi:hypothetical protein Tco_0869964 [Tanacetum coccineum]